MNNYVNIGDYSAFIEKKTQLIFGTGFEPSFYPEKCFDFQKYLINWACMRGRAAIFADTGLGKTLIFLAMAENIARKTNGNVLILTPLAVSFQTIKEGEKFGIEVKRSRDGKPAGKITVTNYQQLEKFDCNDYVCCICDESSAIKDSEGQTKKNVVRFMGKMQYRFLFTATPSPNDFIELGTSSEALGYLNYMDMLSQFFRDTSNDKNPQWSTPKYELKKHAVNDFWRWVSSWARAVKKPSDLGFSDALHVLPKLIETEHILDVTKPLDGELFARKAATLGEQRQERKNTISERIDKVIQLCDNHERSIIWGHYDYETDALEKAVKNAIQISGRDSDESKEEKFIAFTNGDIQRLVIKPKIGAWGLNWQHCNHMTFFPSHSYEQYYQGVRRCWRFGQQKPVYVDTVTTEGEGRVTENIKRKATDAEIMFSKLVEHMSNELTIERKEYKKTTIKLPKFLQ
jgi:hypothetical protein